MPWRNPIVAGEQLQLNSIQSPDYVPGVSGWAIFRDGTAEFNDVTIRGSITLIDLFAGTVGGPSFEIDGDTGLVTVTGTTGRVLEILPSNITPMIRFWSQNKNVYAYINQAATSPAQDNHASLGMNSGQYIAADGVARTIRNWLNSASNVGRFEVVNAITQAINGGFVHVRHDAAFFGYDNNAGIANYMFANVDGLGFTTPVGLGTNEAMGSVSVAGGSGAVTSSPIAYNLTGTGNIRGWCTAVTGSAAFVNASLTNITATGADVNVLRNNATATSIYWYMRRDLV